MDLKQDSAHTPEILDESQLEAVASFAWGQIEEIGLRREEIQPQLDELYAYLSQTDVNRLGLYAKESYSEKQARYTDLFEQLATLKEYEDEILKLLEKVEAKTLTSNDLQESPTDRSDNTVAVQPLSKRRLAIKKAHEKALKELLDTNRYIDPYVIERLGGEGVGAAGLSLPHETHELTTGRNRKRLVTDGTLDTLSAPEIFFDITADTHGGKVSHGKNGRFYPRSGGKRLRKY